jgi:hypothetical protein
VSDIRRDFLQGALGNEEKPFEIYQDNLLSLPFRLIIRLKERSPIAEVKNEWSYTSTPLKCLQDVDGDEFTFTHIPWPDKSM